MNKDADEKRKKDIETRNRAENFINQIDETLKQDNANVTPEQKAEVQKLRDELQSCLDNNDMATLEAKLNELEAAAQKMAEAMYQQQNAGSGDAYGNPNMGGNDDNVVDADFTEKH